jgi:hypothetical protein
LRTVEADATLAPALLAALGDIVVYLDINQYVDGFEVASAVGDVSIIGTANVTLVGLLGTMALGNIVVSGTWDPADPVVPSGSFEPITAIPSAGWDVIIDPGPSWLPVNTGA